MIIRFIIYLFVFTLTTVLHSQQDPEAERILDRSAEKTNSCNSIQADFQLIISNRIEDTESVSEGNIIISDDKYYIEMMGSEIFYNGNTMWTWIEDIEEVTITEPDTASDDFTDNPAKIFTFYNRDFKFNLDGEKELNGEIVYVISLFPNNLNQPYSRIRIYVSKEDLLVKKVISVGKQGVDYIIILSDIKTNVPVNDTDFEFDISKHKKAEVIDLRF